MKIENVEILHYTGNWALQRANPDKPMIVSIHFAELSYNEYRTLLNHDHVARGLPKPTLAGDPLIGAVVGLLRAR